MDDIFRLDEYLFNKYHYRFNGDYQDLSDQSFIQYESIGANSVVWLNIEGDDYLVKRIDNGRGRYAWLGELLSQKIAEVLGIPTAEYRVCRLGDDIAIMSKKFTKENETIILGAHIIQEAINRYPYLRDDANHVLEDDDFIDIYNIPEGVLTMDERHRYEYLHNNLNNLEELWSIVDIYLRLNYFDPNYLNMIMDYLVRLFMFDCLTIQGDRHMGNWAIVVIKNPDGSKSIRVPELFDNSASFNLWEYDIKRPKFYRFLEDYQKRPDNKRTKENIINALYANRLLLTPSEDAIKNVKKRKREPNNKVLEYFLTISDSDTIRTFKRYYDTLLSTDIGSLLKAIEDEQHIKIDEDVKKYIIDIIRENMNLLGECLKTLSIENGRGLSE